MNGRILIISISVTLFGLGGCCSPKLAVENNPCPPKPIYPKISDKELQPLSDETYDKLVDMISYRDEYISQLRIYCNERTD